MLPPTVARLRQRLPKLPDMLQRSLSGDIAVTLDCRTACGRCGSIPASSSSPSSISPSTRATPCRTAAARRSRPASTDARGSSRRLGGSERRIRRDLASRHRDRHCAGRSPESLRALLHHQGSRQGHRPRAEPGLRLRQTGRRTATVSSEVDRGTEITIYLPRTATRRAAPMKSDGVAPASRRGRSCWSRTTPRSPRFRNRTWSSSVIRSFTLRMLTSPSMWSKAAGPSIWSFPTSSCPVR